MPGETTYRIGAFELMFPADHLLGSYQSNYRLYDWALGEIARLVAAKYPDAAAIDIGANVGDTAAVICRHQNVPVLCIEGHPAYLPYLRRNLDRLPGGIEVAESFVGAAAGSVAVENFWAADGTAGFDNDASVPAGGDRMPVRPLADILHDHPAFMRPRLLKSDTDGADFDILLSAVAVLRTSMPVLFFEYDPTLRQDGAESGIRTIEALASVGYGSFCVYDNFGNFLEIVRRDVVDRFADLTRYLMSHFFFGRQIYYFDVCAFSSEDEDLAAQLHELHSETVDICIRRAGRQIQEMPK
jgi:FkbM family methyltransferase